MLYIILSFVALLLSGIRIAQEFERALVFRLGWVLIPSEFTNAAKRFTQMVQQAKPAE